MQKTSETPVTLKVGDRLMAKESWRYVQIHSKHPLEKYWMDVVLVNDEHCVYDSFLFFANGEVRQFSDGKLTQTNLILDDIAAGHLELVP
jgi:hypothetical protein